MRIAYFDCPTGVSGDMLLGACLDCGVSIDEIKEGLALLHIKGYEIQEKRIIKSGLAAIQVEVLVQDNVKERMLSEILTIVSKSQLPVTIKEKAINIFQRIGLVEANIHRLDVEKVHLHELGGLDTIIDVVGVLLCMQILKIEEAFASPLPSAQAKFNLHMD